MNRIRLDKALVDKGLVASRSQAESYIKLGKVKHNGRVLNKSSILVGDKDKLEVTQDVQYVSRAALKLQSVSGNLDLDFKDKVVLDVGSSTGGFSDFALRKGAKKVIAVDVGTDQLHPVLREHPRVELHEKTDIRSLGKLSSQPSLILIDVSFVSLRQILPHISKLADKDSQIVAMVKPQFEAGAKEASKGVIKNDSLRRKVLKDFEAWARDYFLVLKKADSQVAGAKGNLERFYLLKKLTTA